MIHLHQKQHVQLVRSAVIHFQCMLATVTIDGLLEIQHQFKDEQSSNLRKFLSADMNQFKKKLSGLDLMFPVQI